MPFLDKLKSTYNVTTTENGAKAYRSTKSYVLDLFALGGASRNKSEQELSRLIIQALDEDAVTAAKVIFYLSDIREGQGERRLFKIALPILLTYFNNEQLLSLVPDNSRWDLLINLYNTNLAARKIVNQQFVTAVEGVVEVDPLFFKWLPSVRAHGKYNALAKQIYTDLGISPKLYRKILKDQRARLNLVETNLTNKTYNKIDYNAVPSKAGVKYRTAFHRNDGVRYTEHVNKALQQAKDLASGKITEQQVTVRLNASTLYPSEILNKYSKGDARYPYYNLDETVETLWLSQKDFLKDLDDKGILPIIDTSGSMASRLSYSNSALTALDVALGFGIYFAERLKGPYKNHFINFSERPTLNKLVGNSLHQKLRGIDYNNWGGSTNVQAAFDLILDTAVKNKVPQSELPSAIIIFSDMEFDSCGRNYTNLELAKQKFESKGYTLPNLVFWNVNSRNEQVAAKMNDQGVALVSGYSPSAIRFITTGAIKTPYETMLETINNGRYIAIDSLDRL